MKTMLLILLFIVFPFFLSNVASQEFVVVEALEVPVLQETKQDLDYIMSIEAILKTRHNVKKKRFKEFMIRDQRRLQDMSEKYELLSKNAEYPSDIQMYGYYSRAFKSLSKRKKRGFYKNWKKAMRLRYE